MTPTALPLLSLGTSSFPALRLRRQRYVDKTAMVFDLASRPGPFLLTRPRRFGKSLLISTFESLFKYGLRDFEGLAMEKLWREKPVCTTLRIDFSSLKSCPSLESFSQEFDDYLDDLMLRERLKAPIGMTGLRAFGCWLAAQPPRSVVVLVDEYDAPLSASLENPELFHRMGSLLSAFYAQLKACEEALRFLFVTGITNFHKSTLFSSLETLTDISLTDEFSALLGFTRDEVEASFGEHLERAARLCGLARDELMEKLTRTYGGCVFSRDARQSVLAPWRSSSF